MITMRSTLPVVALVVAGCTGEIGAPAGMGGPGNGNPPAGSVTGTATGGSSTGGSSTGGSSTGGSSTGTGMDPLMPESPSPRFVRQLTLNEYRNTVTDLLQIANPDITAIPPDVPVKGFTTNVAAAFVSEAHLEAYMSVGTALANRAVTESYAKIVPCQTQDTACAGTFIDKFGLRAFRRPITAEERARYVKYFDATLTGGDFKAGVSLAIWGMLVSPHFLFRTELGDPAGADKFALSPYEVATALSYTYWGTMPDDALFASASSGALTNKTEIDAQTRRLLFDPRGRARIATFFSEWTEASRAYVATKDLASYPTLFKDMAAETAIVDAMKAEQDAFFTNVVFDSTKKFSELFTANYTFANDRLATLYGLPPPGTGDKTTKVAFKAGSQRGGMLTLGMFLYGHARTNQSSPVQRGHMIRANILCTDVPPPPAGVDATVKPGTPGKTGREQIEALTGSGTCTACHGLMNPIGFALEGFGGAAEDRTTDNGEPVDTTGDLKGFTNAAGMPVTFNGARELSTFVATNDQARSCLGANYFRYTRGFLPSGVDTVAVNKLSLDYAKRDLEMPELFVGVALQDSFTTRRSVEVLDQ
jgi:hypothetical protein